MACIISSSDIKWILEKQPGLHFSNTHNVFYGTFSFSAKYKDQETINDHYHLEIRCNEHSDTPLPAIYETSGRISRMSRILGIDTADLHVNYDNTLCIVRPDKFRLWYPKGFDIKIFEQNLTTHLYWLSYRERFGKEPWPGEEHGGNFRY
mgnify:FL=1